MVVEMYLSFTLTLVVAPDRFCTILHGKPPVLPLSDFEAAILGMRALSVRVISQRVVFIPARIHNFEGLIFFF